MIITKQNKVAIYCRLSRDDGETNESSSITNQKEMLVEYANENKFTIYNIYIDDGYSGGNFNRPGWNELLKDLKEKKFNIILTKDLSRLGRNYLETGYYTEEFFPNNNIRYIAVNDNYDSNNEDNDLTPFKNIINQWYLKDISKKVKQVNAHRMKQGKLPNGNQIPLYGYKHDENNERVIDEESSANIVTLFKLYNEGLLTKQISGYFYNNKIPTPAYYNYLKYNYNPNNWIEADDKMKYYWGRSIIARIISNKQYLGILELGKTKTISYKTHKRVVSKEADRYIFENRFPAIIDQETWNKAQNIKKNRSKSIIKAEDNPYYNFLYCGTCGKALTLNSSSNKKNQAYICRRTSCSKPTLIQLKHIEEVINLEINSIMNLLLSNKNELKKEIINYNKNKINFDFINKEIEGLRNKNNKLEMYIKRLFEKSVDDKIPIDTMYKMMNTYQEELKENNNKLKKLISINNSKLNEEDINDFEQFVDYLYEIKSCKISRKILLSLIDGIEVIRINKTTIKLKYRYKTMINTT